MSSDSVSISSSVDRVGDVGVGSGSGSLGCQGWSTGSRKAERVGVRLMGCWDARLWMREVERKRWTRFKIIDKGKAKGNGGRGRFEDKSP